MAKILIVDDSTSMRQMTAFTLKGAGHTVVEAKDGQQGLDAVKNNSDIKLIISDINMPVMDGITMVKQVRDIAAFKFTPILLLTTEAGMDKKQEGRAAGATGWIVKPFSPDKLIATVNKVL
ncbi:response regulator [Saccharobesus litoralis]|uniref:Response regulator n=1 Tax=Saccharobesus litoralis TaxID=2172099 RepID=A0A2S0VX56_9ALTE|nr:response regulator [Saccharobesus litoralis]AWB68765.1 response regulator [Saccharobesus litoralis]